MESVRKFFRSFTYAAKGIGLAIRQERNFRFHLCATAYVYSFSLFYEFSAIEYGLLTIVVVGVMALELINSALERCVAKPSEDKYMLAGEVKDLAAGAVLVFSIGAASCGICLFGDLAVISQIIAFLREQLLWLGVFLLSLVCSFFFIFQPNKGREEEA